MTRFGFRPKLPITLPECRQLCNSWRGCKKRQERTPYDVVEGFCLAEGGEMTFGKRVDGPGGRRRASRSPTSMRAQLTTPTNSIEAWIIDMSSTGAKLRSTSVPEVGQSVLVRVGSLEAFGTVAWTAQDSCGISFHPPANDAEREALAQILEIFGGSVEE